MAPSVTIVIGLALLFGLLNGMHDARNVVFTLISSRAYSARVALGVTALAELTGPFVFGVAVANAIGRGIVQAEAIDQQVLIAAVGAAILWNLITWFLRMPSSSSHALVGGLLGAASIHAGAQAVEVNGLFKTLISLFASPIVGFVFGFFVLRLIFLLSWNATPRINEFFKRSQILTAIVLGLSHGSNDSQKMMGVITLALVTGGYLDEFSVPLWVIAACALALAVGTTVGGWRLIHRVGASLYKIRPVDGFATQLTSSLVIVGASLIGGPVSATQVINSAIMGIGTAERASKVRWGIAQEIVTAWFLTIPCSAMVAAGLYYVITRISL
ncbi:MAG: inorganic phosphate transporter [Chloroflexota bacterium]